jgi:chromatin segregation and condensation protein Rec8/ScpA/Scc1 (kleisin family)
VPEIAGAPRPQSLECLDLDDDGRDAAAGRVRLHLVRGEGEDWRGLLLPLAQTQDELARLEAEAALASKPMREGLVARLPAAVDVALRLPVLTASTLATCAGVSPCAGLTLVGQLMHAGVHEIEEGVAFGGEPTVIAGESAPPRQRQRTIFAEDLAWQGPERRAPASPSEAPVLKVAGFEDPLDWLLEQTRAGRIDLARLPVLALIEQCVAALDVALAQQHGDGDGSGAQIPLHRLSDWLVMAAWLAWLRSRLLLPEDDLEVQAAREEAEALRRGLADRARARNAVAWLDAQLQLGRDVFARGGMSARASAERAADLPVLLRTYARLIGPLPEQEKTDTYRSRSGACPTRWLGLGGGCPSCRTARR